MPKIDLSSPQAMLDSADRLAIDMLRPGSCLRSSLIYVQEAIRDGRLSGESGKWRRIAVLNALAAVGDAQLTPRVAARFAKVYAQVTALQEARS
jgi:hypothetical protein